MCSVESDPTGQERLAYEQGSVRMGYKGVPPKESTVARPEEAARGHVTERETGQSDSRPTPLWKSSSSPTRLGSIPREGSTRARLKQAEHGQQTGDSTTDAKGKPGASPEKIEQIRTTS